MSTEAKRWLLAFVSLLACMACPAVMVVLAEKCDSGRNPNPDDIWLPSLAVDTLFLVAVLFAVAVVCAMPRHRWIGVLIAIPLLIVTAVLAITCGLWIEGTYF